MNTKAVFTKKLYEITLFFLICWGAHAWFTWDLDTLDNLSGMIPLIIACGISYFYQVYQGIQIGFTKKNILIYFSFLFGMSIFDMGITTPINSFLKLYPLFVLINDEDNLIDHITKISRWIAIILIPGIILHLFIISSGITIPTIPIQKGDLSLNFSYLFWNYGFMIRHIDFEQDEFRFQSIFLEPGYLGTLLAFLLYTLQYNLKKWETKVFTIALLLSFSLAGYLTTFIGIFLYNLSQGKSVKTILYVALFTGITYFGATTYNYGDNIVNKLIIERLQYDEEKVIVGNNRVSQKTDDAFEMALDKGELLTGTSKYSNEDLIGTGYKKYFLTHGIISALFYLLFYILLASYTYNYIYAFGYVVLIISTFLQASYPNSYSWIIPFLLGILGIEVLDYKADEDDNSFGHEISESINEKDP